MRQNETQRTIESRIAIETAGDSYWRESGSEIVSIHSITIREYDMEGEHYFDCLLYTSPSPRDRQKSRMPSSA